MLALPPAPAPAPRRQILVGTAIASAAIAAAFAGMTAMWLRMRQQTITAEGRWIPKDVKVQVVASNVILLCFIPACIFAQWAVYSAKRDDKPHTGAALGLVGLMGLAMVNAQAYIYSQMKMPATNGTYSALFYSFTGLFVVAAIGGIVFSAVTAFRYLGGRTADRELVAAHALYWYVLSAAFSLLWFVVYVTK